jgi:hypothetical protein
LYGVGQRAPVVLVGFDNLIGWDIAPLPAESHAANRTHLRPAALNGISK